MATVALIIKFLVKFVIAWGMFIQVWARINGSMFISILLFIIEIGSGKRKLKKWYKANEEMRVQMGLWFAGVLLQVPNIDWISDYLPEIMELNEDVSAIIKTLFAIIGLAFLWRSYQLRTESVKGKRLDNSIKEKELDEESKTD